MASGAPRLLPTLTVRCVPACAVRVAARLLTRSPARLPARPPGCAQVAWAELRRVRQGVYVCANGGNCTAPGICRCPPGWVGFDCRTPVCRQGYFEEGQDGRAPLNAHRHPGWAGHAAGQGAYECSIRAHTQWEWRWCSGGQCAQYVHNHPNFYSRYMDDRPAYQQYGVPLRTGMGWPATHERLPPLGDNTRLGWQRDGWWQRVAGAVWVKGVCTVEFQRMCPGEAGKAARLFGGLNATVTEDTEDTFAPVVTYGTYAVDAVGRWDAAGGECVDHVLRGCFNNGTCVAPGQCQCAPGWSGHDCKTPVCEQACLHGGNCTAPNTCTCELGWSGHDCSQALCAQECRNGGHCAAPDVCECARWPSAWVDRRLHGGRPLYRDPAGNSQLTGWTGYDCNTRACPPARLPAASPAQLRAPAADTCRSHLHAGAALRAERRRGQHAAGRQQPHPVQRPAHQQLGRAERAPALHLPPPPPRGHRRADHQQRAQLPERLHPHQRPLLGDQPVQRAHVRAIARHARGQRTA